MGVQVIIEDDLGQQCSGRERRCYCSDTKSFAQTLLEPLLWEAIGRVCGTVTTNITYIVNGEAVPDELSHQFPTWELFYQSRFQEIYPLIILLSSVASFIRTTPDWVQQFQREWFKHEELKQYYYDDYFPEGYFLQDIQDTLRILQSSMNNGATSVCISLG